jgi:signal transduction histidine kinase
MEESPEHEEGKVIYRRLDLDEPEISLFARTAASLRGFYQNLVPTLTPLLFGFGALLFLVFLLGFFSEREINNVEQGVTELQARQTEKVELFFDLSVAAYRLNNEARVQSSRIKRNEFGPIFEGPLNDARRQLRELFPRFNRQPFSQHEQWQILQQELETYLKTTEDIENYDENGFVQFRDIRKQFEILEGDIKQSQALAIDEALKLRSIASRRVRVLWTIALMLGAFVVVATVWEVQRRYNQTRRSYEVIQRERRFSSQILEGMVSAVAAIDSRGRICSANAPFFEIFSNVKIGDEIGPGINPASAHKMLEAAYYPPAKAGVYRGRWKIDELKNEKATSRTFDLYVSPLEIDGEAGHIITLVDVTEAADTENELRRKEALAAVGQATAQVAHEIKNPLGSIRLGVSMLRDMTKDKASISTINLVDRGIDHLQKLIMDVTQFSRQKPLTLVEVDLHSLIDESLDLVANLILDNKTPIERLYSSAPLIGEFDEDQLRQVFVNVIANAIDASEEGQPVVISTRHIEREVEDIFSSATEGVTPMTRQPFVQIVITDNGCGMDEETQKNIFKPFYSTKAKGTGLGLAIVKRIVEKHEGSITLKSEVGIGTSFTIELPVRENFEVVV